MDVEDLDLSKLSELLLKHFNYSELFALSFDLNVDFDSLAGESKSAKVRELITLLKRHDRLDEIIKVAQAARPSINWNLNARSETTDPTLDADILRIELSSLRQQLNEIQKGVITDEQLEQRLDDMLKTTNRAIGRSEELTARVLLPPPELTDVQLLPAGALDRLEEYRADENIVYLLIGAFAGTVLGIISNWVTNDPLIITKISVVLIILFLCLTVTCVFWAWRLKRRADLVKKQVFAKSFSPQTTTPQ